MTALRRIIRCQLCLHRRESAQSDRSCRLGELQLSLALCYCSILHSHVPILVLLPERDLPLHVLELPRLKELSLTAHCVFSSTPQPSIAVYEQLEQDL